MASKRDKLRKGAKANFNTGHLRPAQAAIPEAGDPLEPLTITLTLDDLTPYDKNPRNAANEAWEAILDETRSLRGLDGVLPVTRRPGETLYFPKRGGNTRLRALRHLWDETGDEAFYRIDCKVYPWTSEADVLTAHLADNDNRGGVIFIDRALGVRNLRLELEKAAGEKLSSRALAEKMKGTGYAIGYTIIQLMDYAVDVLQPAIPNALNRGLGKPQIEGIRKLHNQLRKAWAAENPDIDAFEAVFSEALADSDDDFWSLDLVSGDLYQRVANALDIPESHLQLSLTSLSHGQGPVVYEPDPGPSAETGKPESEPATGSGPVAPPPDPPPGSLDLSPSTSSGSEAPESGDVAPAAAGPAAGSAPPVLSQAAPGDDLDELRSINFELARTVASAGKSLKDDVFAWEYGYGFCLDLPSDWLSFENPIYNKDSESLMRDKHIYLLLMGLSETHHMLGRVLTLPSHLTAVKRLSDQIHFYRDYFERFCPRPRHETIGFDLLNNRAGFDDEQLQNLFNIIMNNRRMRSLVNDPTGAALFPPPVKITPPRDSDAPTTVLGLDPEQSAEILAALERHKNRGGGQ